MPYTNMLHNRHFTSSQKMKEIIYMFANYLIFNCQIFSWFQQVNQPNNETTLGIKFR